MHARQVKEKGSVKFRPIGYRRCGVHDHFDKLSDEKVKENEGFGVKNGDYKGTVQLGGRDVPGSFTAL